MKLAYLVSRYPQISMTFILREVRTLRTLGFDIRIASINLPDHRQEQLTAVEREEVAQTYYIKPAGVWGALKAHWLTLLTQPLSYFRGLWFALRLGKWDLKKNLYGLFYFVEAVMVGQWMRRQQCSHLHIHLGTAAATVGLIAHRTFPITFSLTIHGPQDFYDVPGYYLTQKVLAAKFVCCISYFTRSQLMVFAPPLMWPKLEVSRLGVDPTTFSPRPFRQAPNPFEIVCIGRLVSEKGQLILVQAVADLLAQGRQLRLRLVGDGPERQHLEQEVQQKNLHQQILFAGAVNQDRVLELYQETDIFVLASFAEGIPVVLMEAMVMEIPCITTRITGIAELITDGQEGILVAPSDKDALMQAIVFLMDNPIKRQQLGQAGRQKVLQEYELTRNTAKLADIFQRRITLPP
jgi:glycosyltransferase involved in cell wall biosynthesis